MGADLKMAGDGRQRIHIGNVHSLMPLLPLCYSTHKSSFCEEEREYSDGTAKESSGGWKGVRELVGSASLSRCAEASRPSGIARYSMESEDSPRFLRRGRSEIGWNTDPPSLYRDGGFIFFKRQPDNDGIRVSLPALGDPDRRAVSQTEPQSVASFDLASNFGKVGTPCLAY